jgi:hypothetical protein
MRHWSKSHSLKISNINRWGSVEISELRGKTKIKKIIA